jgi:hypothetical protein
MVPPFLTVQIAIGDPAGTLLPGFRIKIPEEDPSITPGDQHRSVLVECHSSDVTATAWQNSQFPERGYIPEANYIAPACHQSTITTKGKLLDVPDESQQRLVSLLSTR